MSSVAGNERRVGLLGGTFDPVHRGHLHLARIAERVCGLTRIYFVPSAYPWHRTAPPRASYADRYAMLALALARHPRWLPLDIPAISGFTYTIDQLHWLQRHYPGERIYLIMGADAFITLPSWKHYRQLLRLCDFVVVNRDGRPLDDLSAVLPAKLLASPIRGDAAAVTIPLPGGRRLFWLPHFQDRAQATRVRHGLAAAQPVPSLPASVAQYARRARLYTHA